MSTSHAALAETPSAESGEWITVCTLNDLVPGTGMAALVNQQQVAIFYSNRLDELFAIGNYDPIGKANVLSRGIIGSIGDRVVVASPLYKEHYDLRTGECVESEAHSVPVYPVRCIDNQIQVQV